MVNVETIYEKLLDAFRHWHVTNESRGLLLDLLIVQQIHHDSLQRDAAILPRTATNHFLKEQMARLLPGHQEGVAVLELRFIENMTADEVGDARHYSQDQIYRLQRHTLQELAGAVVEQENNLRRERLKWFENNLKPPTYSQLFGVERIVKRLFNRLLEDHLPFLTAVCGLGGIGKTAVADYVVRQVIAEQYYQRVIWVSHDPSMLAGDFDDKGKGLKAAFEQIILAIGEQAEIDVQSLSPRQREKLVYQLLRDERCLVVVDNLEDLTETATLLLELQRFTNPTHFLLTSRSQPIIEAPVFMETLLQLEQEESVRLLRHEAKINSINPLVEAESKQLKVIYDCVGGNPLALKLVAGLARTMPLSAILEGLKHGRSGPTEAVFRRVYKYAWQQLSESAKLLLESMVLVSETGGRPEQLLAVSGLSEAEMWPAVRELSGRSLLEVRGTLDDRRYGIHRLTLAFLEAEVTKWPDWS